MHEIASMQNLYDAPKNQGSHQYRIKDESDGQEFFRGKDSIGSFAVNQTPVFKNSNPQYDHMALSKSQDFTDDYQDMPKGGKY